MEELQAQVEHLRLEIEALRDLYAETARMQQAMGIVVTAAIKANPHQLALRNLIQEGLRQRLERLPEASLENGAHVDQAREEYQDLERKIQGWLDCLRE